MTQTQTTSAAVTLDDVRGAIGDGDPQQSSAHKVRTVLGRGSHETIQRHLVTLRQEALAKAAPEAEQAAPPPMPMDAMRALWAQAYTAAKAESLARLDRLAAERDEARAWAESLARDVAGLAGALDEQAAQMTRLADAAAEARDERDTAQRITADLRGQTDELYRTLAEQERAAAHAAELAGAGMAVMRAEMERLSDQVAELKAALYQRAQVQASPPAA